MRHAKARKGPAEVLQGGSRFRVQPDPPVAGEPLEVTYIGPAAEVEWQVDGGKPVRVRPDRDGRFRIPAVPRGNEIMFSDNLGLPGYLHRRILEPFVSQERLP